MTNMSIKHICKDARRSWKKMINDKHVYKTHVMKKHNMIKEIFEEDNIINKLCCPADSSVNEQC